MNYSRYYERIMKKLYSQVKKVIERIHVTHNNQKWFGKAGNPVFVSLSPFHPKLPFPNSVLFRYPLSIISLPFPLNCISHPSPLYYFFICYPSSPFSSPLNCISQLPIPSLLYLSPLTPSLSLVSITFLPFFILKFPRFHSFSNSPYCLLYNSYDIGPKNQV